MATFAEIMEFLNKTRIDYEAIELGGKAYTVDDVVASGKVTKDEIVKTLLLKTEKGFIAICCKGEDKIDFGRIQSRFGRSRLAKSDEVKEIAGVGIGAVCPIKIGVPVLLDHKVLKNVKVNLGSGSHFRGLNLTRGNLLKAIENYEIVDIVL